MDDYESPVVRKLRRRPLDGGRTFEVEVALREGAHAGQWAPATTGRPRVRVDAFETADGSDAEDIARRRAGESGYPTNVWRVVRVREVKR